jgi:hypothetical protein
MIAENCLSFFDLADQFIFTHCVKRNYFREAVQYAPLNGKGVVNKIRNDDPRQTHTKILIPHSYFLYHLYYKT